MEGEDDNFESLVEAFKNQLLQQMVLSSYWKNLRLQHDRENGKLNCMAEQIKLFIEIISKTAISHNFTVHELHLLNNMFPVDINLVEIAEYNKKFHLRSSICSSNFDKDNVLNTLKEKLTHHLEHHQKLIDDQNKFKNELTLEESCDEQLNEEEEFLCEKLNKQAPLNVDLTENLQDTAIIHAANKNKLGNNSIEQENQNEELAVESKSIIKKLTNNLQELEIENADVKEEVENLKETKHNFSSTNG